MPEKPSPAIVWPSLIAAVLGIYSYFTYSPPLETARPEPVSDQGFPSPPTAAGVNAVAARLWEDPLAVIYENPQTKVKTTNVGSCSADQLKEYLRVATRTDKSSTSGKQQTSDPDLIVLPVLLPGGMYAEDRERRMRMRYAVVSGLSLGGYRAKFAKRLSSVTLPVWVDGIAVEAPTCIKFTVPFKLFVTDSTEGMYENAEEEEPNRPILVCWIDEGQLGDRPLAVIAQILEHLLGNGTAMCPAAEYPWLSATLDGLFALLCQPPPRSQDPIQADVRILGPSNSDMLLKMAYENDRWFESKPGEEDEENRCRTRGPEERSPAEKDPFIACRHNRLLSFGYFSEGKNSKRYLASDVIMYSTRATVAARYLRNKDTKDSECALTAFTGEGEFAAEVRSRSGIIVARTIGTDLHLFTALKNELDLRDAWPAGRKGDRKARDGFVVLITERDTLYGRALPAIFAVKLQKDELAVDKVLASTTYLRGIDGRTPQHENTSSEGKTNHSHDATGKPRFDEAKPQGQSQFDYLRRLELELLELQKQLRRDGRRGITAIGVVGTDVFDKLLVLRALRRRLPGAVFFTTDLDANFWRSTEYPTTRNVVVASHFALQLHPDLQRDVAPFRGSYQTSLFLATLFATGDHRAKGAADKILIGGEAANRSKFDYPETRLWSSDPSKSPMSPLIFEIGRHGPYQLTTTDGDTGMIPKRNDGWNERLTESGDGRENRSRITALIHPVSPRERRTVVGGYWPEILLLGGAFVGWLSLNVPSLRKLVDRLLGEKSPRAITWSTLAALVLAVLVGCIAWYDHSRSSGEPFVWFEGISIWPSTIIRLVVFVACFAFFFKGVKDLRENAQHLFDDLDFSDYRELLNEVKSRPNEWRWKAVFDSPVLTSGKTPHAVLCPPWYSLRHQHLMQYLLFRVVPRSVLLAAFGWTILWINRPRIPYRGFIADWCSFLALLFSAIALVFLTQYVMDQVLLCRRFIRQMSDLASDLVRNHPRRIGDPQIPGAIQAIARRTDQVGKLTQYPFGLLFVMFVAQLTIFDDWGYSISALLVWTLLFASLLWSAWYMRRDAQNARRKLIDGIADERTTLMRNTQGRSRGRPRSRPSPEYLAALIRNIENEHRGAFAPWTEDYLLRALAIPAGGTGGWLLLDQFFAL